jgi:lysophospholipase L1-like esterase
MIIMKSVKRVIFVACAALLCVCTCGTAAGQQAQEGQEAHEGHETQQGPAAQEAQQTEVKFRNAYYDARRSEHDAQPPAPGAVVFVGNSITEQGWWSVLFRAKNIVNRGIGGDNTYGILDRLPDILAGGPSKLFIMAGINDLYAGRDAETIAANIARMVEMARQSAPKCKVYIQSVLPVNLAKLAYPGYEKNDEVARLNNMLRRMCEQTGATGVAGATGATGAAGATGATWIDLTPVMTDAGGQLKAEFTKDGIHLHPEGYVAWTDHIKKNKHLK